MPDYDKSLGDQNTFDGSSKPADRGPQSLGDEATLGGGSGSDDGLYDDDMEVVDLESRYTTEGTLGKGGMGEVLLATDTRLNRKVAIKRILGSAARSKTAVNRFLTEAQSIAALNHPNIVQIYDYGRAKDGSFLIMEYVEGGSLLDKCREGAIPVEEAIELTRQLCDGLVKAHSANIVHRDIKPANVLLTPDGVPKLTDFGLAKAETADTGMTMAGVVLGTLDFMPPEQRRDASAVDHRSDLWSLAATFYQMVTGKSPKIIKFNNVPKSLHEVLGKALEDEKDDRYQSAVELRTALRVELTDSSGLPVSELGAGECPDCRTRNESNRKYCRECAAFLLVDCLGCGESIAVWDKICGECGNNQEEAVKAKLSEYTRLQEEAEGLRLSHRCEEAIELSKQGANDYESIFPDATAWAEKFTADTKRDQAEQLEKTEKIYDAAKKARANNDCRSACQLMEEIPKELLSSDMKDFFQKTEREYNHIKYLQQRINDRLSSEKFDGLLPIIDELLRFQPHRSSVKRLHEKMVEWEKQTELRNLEDRIENLSGRGMFTEALSLVQDFLQRNPKSKAMLELRDDLKKKLLDADLRKLEERIRVLGERGQLSEALSQVENRLQIYPVSERLLRLKDDLKRKQCVVRDARAAWQQEFKKSQRSFGQSSAVNSVAFSPDGKSVVCGNRDATIVLLDVFTGEKRFKLEGTRGSVSSVSFSPTRGYVGSGGFDETIKIFDMHTGEETLALNDAYGSVYSVAFSPDGKLIAAGSWKETFKIWDAKTGILKHELLGHTEMVRGVAFSPDGNKIVSCSRDKSLKIWDVRTGRKMLALEGHTKAVRSVAYSPSGKSIASGSGDKTLKIWNAVTGEEKLTLQSHKACVFCVAFSPDGRSIVSGSGDQTLKVWDTQTGDEEFTLEGHTGFVTSVSFSPDGNNIISGSDDKTIKIWDVSAFSSR